MKRAIPAFLISAALGGAGGALLKSGNRPSLPAENPGLAAAAPAADPPADLPAKPQSRSAGPSDPRKPGAPRPGLEELRAAPKADQLRLLIRWLPEATPAEIAALAMEWFPENNHSGSGNEVWQVLVQRWVEVDATAALDHARKISRSFDAHFLDGTNIMTPLHYAYRALARHDADLAFAFLSGEKGPSVKFLIQEVRKAAGLEKTRAWALSLPDRADLEEFRKELAKVRPEYGDPAKALTMLTPEELRRQGRFLVGEWAKKDPAAALAWAEGLEPGKLRTDALMAVAKELLAKDPAAGLKVLESLPPSQARSALGAEYVGTLAKTDPAAAWKYMEANLKGVPRLQAIAALAAAKAATDPAAALKMLKDHGIGDLKRSRLMRTEVTSPNRRSTGFSQATDYAGEVLKAAAVKDPAGVMDLLSVTGGILINSGDDRLDPDGPHKEGFLARSLFKEWAAKDPASAVRWAASQPSGEAMRELAKNAAAPWFETDPAAVRAFAASLPAGPGRNDFVRTTASLMAGNDPAGALAWTAQTGGAEVLGSVFQTIARTDPEFAVTQFGSLPTEVQAARMQELTDVLGRRAPASAVNFYQSLAADQQASVKLYETTLAYARQDPQAASEWVTTLPPTQAKDSAISGLVDYLIRQSSDPDPEAAAHWAAASVDADGRNRRLKRVGEAWFKRDPAGAAAAIGASALPPDVKQTLLNHASPK